MKIFFTQRSFFIKYLLILFLCGGGMGKVSATPSKIKVAITHRGEGEYEATLIKTRNDVEETYKVKFVKVRATGNYKLEFGDNSHSGDKIFGDQTTAEKFEKFGQLRFRYDPGSTMERDRMTLLLQQDSEKIDFKEDAEKSWLVQAMVYAGADPTYLTSDQFKKAIGDPFFGLRPSLLHFLRKATEPGDIGNAIEYSALLNEGGWGSVANGLGNVQVFYVLVEIYSALTLGQATEKFYKSENIEARAKQEAERVKAQTYLKNLFPISCFAIFIFGTVVVINHAASLVFSFIAKKINTPTIFVWRSFSLNWLEWFLWLLFGGPIPPEDEWDKIVSTKQEKAERKEQYEEICWAIEQNKMLSREERMDGQGISINHTIWGGPPGTGKSMTARALAMHLYYEDYTSNIIFIDGAEPSKLDIKDVVEALTVLQLIAMTHYIKTGEPTIVVVDEAEQLCPSHIGGNVSWERQAFTAKLLALQARTSSPYLVFFFTTNLDVRPEHEEEAVKYIDRAALSRMGERIFVGKPSSDILMKVFIQYFKEYIEDAGYKLDHTVVPYIKDNFELLLASYNTQRAFESLAAKWARRIAKNKAKKATAKNSKRRKKGGKKSSNKVNRDDLIPLLEAFEGKQEREKQQEYKW